MPKPPPNVRIPRGSGKAPEICSSCQARGTVAETHVDFPVVIQNEEFICQVPRMICSACDAAYSTPQQFDRSIELGVAAFQKKHGLLTATEIKECRIQVGWKQPDLAHHAKVGIASVKRWERGRQVQTAANDQALRHAFDRASESSDQTYEVVTICYHLPMGELRSFSREKIANPGLGTFGGRDLRSKFTDVKALSRNLPEDCYA
jgi:putative zinc finger/helix-turn-helix YgiT family protein